MRHALERKRERETPQPSIAGRDRRGIDLGRCRDLGEHLALARDARRAGSPPLGQPRARHKARKPACFPEQLCSSGVGSGPVSSSDSSRAPPRGACGQPRAARAGRDATRRRWRSPRLRGRVARGRAAEPGSASPTSGRTQRADGSPASSDPPPALRTATAWTRWRDSSTDAPRDDDLERARASPRGAYSRATLHLVPELPEVEAWVRELDPLVSRAPVDKAGPAHIATLKTFDPPLAALEGRRLAGSARRGQEPPLPDRRRRARSPRASDERRAPALSRGGREGPEDADVPAALRRRRRARPHRGRARRSAQACGC